MTYASVAATPAAKTEHDWAFRSTVRRASCPARRTHVCDTRLTEQAVGV